MFPSGSLEKSSAVADNSPGRNKFTVGMNAAGDENQQNIRIQLAVHRYNNSGNAFIRQINERSISSSQKHTFVKNLTKYRSLENDKEEVPNTFNKSCNHYEGVGNFPSVHLKKNAIIGKPIRRSMNNQFKIQFPELPFNRFLSHSPDITLDTKTSTRSVLDVLQDLSRKRIHTKDDTEANKRNFKGLGGDTPMDVEAPYKPLFVTKTRGNNVTYRDSTTQTQDLTVTDSSISKKNEAVLNNEKDDPKAELRRKLARQNNEIFASLSSSTLIYTNKRGSEKLNEGKEELKKMEPKSKRTKYLSDENKLVCVQNGSPGANDVLNVKNCNDSFTKVEKKVRIMDQNPVSPHKDRLTAIFLEMRNINSKSDALVKEKDKDKEKNTSTFTSLITEKDNSRTPELSGISKSVCENKSLSNPDNKSDNATVSPAVEKIISITAPSSAVTKLDETKHDSNVLISKENTVISRKEATVNEISNITVIQTTSNSSVSTDSTVSSGFSSASPTFRMPIVSTVSSSLTQTPILSTGISPQLGSTVSLNSNSKSDVCISQDNFKNNGDIDGKFVHSPNQNSTDNTLAYGKVDKPPLESTEKPGHGFFKFGASPESCKTGALSSDSNETTATEVEGASIANNLAIGKPSGIVPSNNSMIMSSGSAPVSFSSSTVLTSAALPAGTTTSINAFNQNQQNTSLFKLPDKTSAAGNSGNEKPLSFPFTFGQTSNNNFTEPSLFNSGIKGTRTEQVENKLDTENSQTSSQLDQNKSNNINVTTFGQNLFSSGTFSSPTFGSSVANPIAPSNQINTPFKFGENTKNENTTLNHESLVSSPSTNVFDQKPKASVFNFGQKTEQNNTSAGQPGVSQPNLFQSNVFTFGQKSTVSASNTQTTAGVNLFVPSSSAQGNIFQQSTTSPPTSTTLSISSPFGTSQTSDGLNHNSNQLSTLISTTSASGTTTMTNTITQNSPNVPTFGQSATPFGQASSSGFTTETNIFGSSTSHNNSTFGASTPAQSAPFSQTFGTSTSEQQNNTTQNSNFFNQSSTTINSGFGQSSCFGSNNFGSNSKDNNIFGQKSPVKSFEQNQTIQANPFGQASTSQGFGSQSPFTFSGSVTTTASSAFAMNPSTTASVFTFGSSSKTTAGSSNFGFSGASQLNTNPQSPFSFSNQASNTTFKFGNSGNGGNTSGFSFDTNTTTSEASKSVFNFGGPPTTTTTGFNFGGTPSPVFSFGGQNSTVNSGSKFSFGATQPTSSVFTPGISPTVPLQGVFSIGSGPTQSRSRSSVTRTRRRT